jgi:2-amino-4-hydroxy-6-hydroxymethyldihydropteridine diphosphokinase
VIGYLSLGSNVGDRRAQLQAAVDALVARGVAVTASSSVYDTDPVGEILDQPSFLNVCVRIETTLDPEALLDVAKAIELDQGRDPSLPRHSPRPVDIDLILLGDEPYSSARLTLPHAEATSRRFVMIPLLELDLDIVTPAGVRVADALAALPLDEGVRREGPPLHVPS